MGNKNKGVFSRSLKLFSVASRLAGKEVSERILRHPKLKTRIDQATILTEALSELKGAAMKAGQLLSLEAGDLLPKEATQILSKLQANAEAHPYSEIEAVLKDGLKDKYKDLENISPTPIASASIGQVHKAELRGEPVAIKVQYPGVRESIDSDLRIIRKVAESFVKISGKNISLKSLFIELKQVLIKETDYHYEAENMRKYSDFLKDDDSYLVPQAFPEYTSENVLTMTWMEGVPILQWIQETESQEKKDLMANLLLDLFCKEFSDWGFVQTDPNFANFQVNANDQLICLDFGATLAYDKAFRMAYAEVLKSFSKGNTDQVFQSAVEFGLLSEKEPRETQIAFKEMIQVALEPFHPGKQPFDFQNKDFEKRTKEVNMRFSRMLQHSAPPKKILFLHRKLGGIFNLVKLMDTKMDLMPYWAKMIGNQT